jgi:hypothetical protein
LRGLAGDTGCGAGRGLFVVVDPVTWQAALHSAKDPIRAFREAAMRSRGWCAVKAAKANKAVRLCSVGDKIRQMQALPGALGECCVDLW